MTQPGERIRPPEVLPLPDEPLGASEPVKPQSPPHLPFSLELDRQRQEYLESFQGLRTRARQERIRALAESRGSRVVVYYAVDFLSPRHAELLQDVLAAREPAENLDLVLVSTGGYSDAAYKMVSLCRSHIK